MCCGFACQEQKIRDLEVQHHGKDTCAAAVIAESHSRSGDANLHIASKGGFLAFILPNPFPFNVLMGSYAHLACGDLRGRRNQGGQFILHKFQRIFLPLSGAIHPRRASPIFER